MPTSSSSCRGNRGSLALQPTGTTATPSYVRKKLNVVPVDKPLGAEPVERFRLRGDQHLVLRPTGEQPVQVKFSRITARGKLVTYSVYGPDGTEVVSGLMSAEVPIELTPAGSSYYHLVISAGIASFMVEVTGAAWAVDGTLDDKGLHFLGNVTPLYFRVPEQTATFHLSLEATPPGETAVATLYAPDGQQPPNSTAPASRSTVRRSPSRKEARMVEAPGQTGSNRSHGRRLDQAGRRAERLLLARPCPSTRHRICQVANSGQHR